MKIKERIIRFLGGVPADFNCNSVKYAESEMQYAWPEPDEMQDLMKSNIKDIMAVFANQGHSGFSASYIRSCLEKVMDFKPLSPLTGQDEEWSEPYDERGTKQNKRCSRVFMDADGRSYDIDGKVFREYSGACFTNIDSRVYIEFPYTPKTEYVDVRRDNDVRNAD